MDESNKKKQDKEQKKDETIEYIQQLDINADLETTELELNDTYQAFS